MPAQTDTPAAGASRLEFSDTASCKAWLGRLPLADTARCHAALESQVRELQGPALPALTQLALLEQLREVIHQVQAARGKTYLGRPVPLDDDERAVWDQVTGLWRSMAAAYDGLIDAMAGPAPELATDAPLICQRALRYTGLAMLECSHVYHSIPAALWKQLHRLYVFAESAGATTVPVDDPVGRAVPTTACAAAYLNTLLVELAQPDALNLQQMGAMERWLERWESLVSLSPVAVAAGTIPALAVDLAAEKGAGLARDLPAAGVRHLNLENLSRVLRQTAAALRQGQAPSQLGLGPLPADACEKLVMLLHIQWCAAGTGRMDERTPGGIVVTIAPHLPAIHYQVSGRAFRPPAGELTARERQNMDMMGLISEASSGRLLVSQRSGTVETWVIVNKSASGFLGMCREPNTATHISHNQLLGLRNPTNKSMFLGTVQRLIVDDSGAIWIGLRLITSAAQAIAARNPDARGTEASQYDRAMLVPEDAGRKTPATVLLLPGWYAANRQLEVQMDRPQRMRLQSLFDKGPNFERATYTLV